MILRFSLLQLVGFVTFAALASAALVQPGPRWLSVVVSLTAAIFVWQAVRAAVGAGESRVAAIGWLVFAAAYLALTLGPWLSEQVGPTLLSSKGLAYAQENWRKESAQDYSAQYMRQLGLDIWGMMPTDGTSNTLYWTDYDLNGRINLTVGSPAASPAGIPVNIFRASGQWLFAWLAGWLGAAIAVFLYRRAAMAQPQVSA